MKLKHSKKYKINKIVDENITELTIHVHSDIEFVIDDKLLPFIDNIKRLKIVNYYEHDKLNELIRKLQNVEKVTISRDFYEYYDDHENDSMDESYRLDKKLSYLLDDELPKLRKVVIDLDTFRDRDIYYEELLEKIFDKKIDVRLSIFDDYSDDD